MGNQKISLFQLRMTPKINFKRKFGIEIPDFFCYLNEIKQVKSEWFSQKLEYV